MLVIERDDVTFGGESRDIGQGEVRPDRHVMRDERRALVLRLGKHPERGAEANRRRGRHPGELPAAHHADHRHPGAGLARDGTGRSRR